MVSKDTTIMTDKMKCYSGMGQDFKGGHKVVNHDAEQYARGDGDANTNTVESYFALLKRGGNGACHHISKKHFSKYSDGFSFRWTKRKVNDGDRLGEDMKGIVEKRFAYGRVVA